AFWPEPQLVVEPDPDDGPVMVLRSYDVPAERVPDFLAAMVFVGRLQRDAHSDQRDQRGQQIHGRID
ncbi:MFS transporter, partial [Nocardia puris]|nr:MFS transporter [Nocardia puris]